MVGIAHRHADLFASYTEAWCDTDDLIGDDDNADDGPIAAQRYQTLVVGKIFTTNSVSWYPQSTAHILSYLASSPIDL